MRQNKLLERFWRRPPTREARNEQKKALGSLVNAVAIAMIVAALIGPAINPDLARLPLGSRALLFAFGVACHYVVRMTLWSLEDK